MKFEAIRPVLHLAFTETPDELIRFGGLDPEEGETTLDRLFADLEGAEIPGFARVAA